MVPVLYCVVTNIKQESYYVLYALNLTAVKFSNVTGIYSMCHVVL